MRHRNDQFEEIYKLVRRYDSDDAIVQTMKLKEISKCFSKSVTDEKILSDLFDFLNTKALQDDSFVTKFVAVVSSRQMDAFIINGKIIRHAMLEILQKNFQSADHFKRDDMSKFYNSIKLLGEYFNRARISNGSPINIIGQSLLNLLNVELEKELKTPLHFKSDDFSEIILTQFALNGNLLKTRHKTEIEHVLINVRKCLIELHTLSAKTKAFLIMTLDLYYANFNESQIGNQLEKIYHSYLLDNSNDNSRTNGNSTTSSNSTQSSRSKQSSPAKASPPPPPRPSSVEKTQPRRVEERKVLRSQSNGRLHYPPPLTINHSNGRAASTDRRSDRIMPKSPLKSTFSRPIQGRRSEPAPRSATPTNNYHHQPQKAVTSPSHKKISPKELRTRQSAKTSPIQDKSAPQTQKTLFKVESAIDKLQIKSDTKQSSNNHNHHNHERQQQQQEQERHHEPPPTTPTKVQQVANGSSDENVLKQQNSNGNSLSKAKAGVNNSNGKVYFKEENVENLSWNGETSFEFDDPELAGGDASPKPNQYSSSFLNFLSNN